MLSRTDWLLWLSDARGGLDLGRGGPHVADAAEPVIEAPLRPGEPAAPSPLPPALRVDARRSSQPAPPAPSGGDRRASPVDALGLVPPAPPDVGAWRMAGDVPAPISAHTGRWLQRTQSYTW
jgi:hypothetical protein